MGSCDFSGEHECDWLGDFSQFIAGETGEIGVKEEGFCVKCGTEMWRRFVVSMSPAVDDEDVEWVDQYAFLDLEREKKLVQRGICSSSDCETLGVPVESSELFDRNGIAGNEYEITRQFVVECIDEK